MFSEAGGSGRGWATGALQVLVARSSGESHFEKTTLAVWRTDRRQE